MTNGAAVRHFAVVTGAPGAGKSTVVAALLAHQSAPMIFDADWLLPAASRLVAQDIRQAARLWPSYRALWLAIIGMIESNGHASILFLPLEPRELLAMPSTPPEVTHWCLLDCSDQVRTERLQRRGCSAAEIRAAIEDGAILRQQITMIIDTSAANADETAAQVLTWFAESVPQ